MAVLRAVDSRHLDLSRLSPRNAVQRYRRFGESWDADRQPGHPGDDECGSIVFFHGAARPGIPAGLQVTNALRPLISPKRRRTPRQTVVR